MSSQLPREVPKVLKRPASTPASIGQCDACSPTVFASQAYLNEGLDHLLFSIPPDLVEQRLDASGYYAVLVPQTGAFALLNRSARLCLDHFSTPRRLDSLPPGWRERWGAPAVREALDELRALGLITAVGESQPEVLEVPHTLTAWLHVTDRCNLRCAYCYLPHLREDMTEETGRAAIEATFRSALKHGYRQVKLKYAGGEPLIRFATLAALHSYACEHGEQCGVEVEGVVLSNGTLLTEEIVSTLQELGMRLMISLDGLGETHDRQRTYAGGRGSSADVMEAIELSLSHGLVPDISITVTGRTAAGVAELVAWVLDRDLPFSLNFYRKNDFSANRAGLQLEENEIIAGLRATFRVIEARLPQRSLLSVLTDRGNLAVPHLRTCGVGHSYLVFDYRGRVSKCQMHMGHSVAITDTADPLALIRLDTTGIQNLSVDEKEGCRTCEWKHWCTGGCPLETYRATGRYDIQSPNCAIYKALYPEVIRLEGLRLLKYGV